MTQYTTLTPAPPRNGFGVTALALGGVAMLFTLFAAAAPAITASGSAFVAILVALVALGFGIPALLRVRRGQATNKVMAWTGTGLAIAAAVLSTGIAVWAESTIAGLDDLGNTTTAAPTAPIADPAGVIPDEPEPVEHVALSVGETMTVGDETNRAAADITVSDVRVTESVTDFGYTEQAANGYFVTFHVEITSTGQEGYTFNPFNYVVISEGRQYQYGDGNSMMVSDVSEQLSSGTLAPGASTEGDITFDVASPHGELSYTPNYDGVPIGSWKF